jgi:hypothetical protein
MLANRTAQETLLALSQFKLAAAEDGRTPVLIPR